MISDMNEKTSYAKEMAEFYKSLKIQLRVIYALLMREIITRYGRHNLGFAWLFLEPMLFTIGIAILWSLIKDVHGNAISIIPFAITGYSTILCWRNSSGRVANAVEANVGLLYHKNVKVLDVFLARIFLECIGATISFIVLMSVAILFNIIALPYDFLIMVYGWVLLIWFSVALALTMGSLFQMSEVLDRLWHAFTYLMFPLSGTAFLVEWLPKNFQQFVLYIPTVHANELIRHGYYGELIRAQYNISYLIEFNMMLTFVGLVLVRYVSRKVEEN